MAKTRAKAKKRKTTRWTAAKKKAFARRMKAARAAKSGKSASKPRRRKKTKSTSNTGVSMARKRRKSVARSSSRKRGGHRGFRMGGGGGSMKSAIMNSVKEAGVAIGGGIVAGVIANKLPISSPLIKAASPVVAGAVLMGTIGRKNKLAAQMAVGMMVLGGVAVIRSKFPQIPLLAGEEEIEYNTAPPELGYYPDDDVMGVEELVGVEEIGADFATAADI
jgi:hypothetical protein